MNSPRLLLVDDEPRFVDSLERILRHHNYDCHKAHNGAEAIRLLTAGDFDLALLDVVLPDMSGCDIAGFIKGSNLDCTAIMLTGAHTVEAAVGAMKQGAYDFLTKPLKHELLLKTLKKGLEHNRLTRELAGSEQKFRLFAEAAWEGVAFQANGRIVETNTPFLEMFGYRRSDLAAGLRVADLLTFDLDPDAIADDGRPTARTMTGTGRKKDGATMFIESRACSTTYCRQPVEVLIVRDLTERIKAEQENLAMQKKLAEANRLNELGLMAGSVAHDLNNILTGIVSYPDMLLMQMNSSDAYYEQIRKIQAAGKRAAAVVSDLVALTRGRVQQKSVENLNEMVMHYLNSLEHGERLAHYSDIVIQTTLYRDLDSICCLPQHIHKVLLNLIGNAMEAVSARGVVQISTENCQASHPVQMKAGDGQSRDYIRLRVADNGPGIADTELDQIFNSFYSTKIQGRSGTGLGLSVVWNIVNEHGGWIEVKNNRPGAVFDVYLPAAKEGVCQAKPIPEIISCGNGERILIVDDQVEQNEIMEKALSGLGYTASSVTSGEAAIEFLQKEHADLLLLDMVMGDGLNGRQTLEAIRRRNPCQRAIVVSGYAAREEIEKTRGLGVSIFLEKPVTLSRITTAIQQSLLKK
ncbi:MAG: response regulator [Desulfopila sp.]